MERVLFYFDPICPRCYQTSRWARRLEGLATWHHVSWLVRHDAFAELKRDRTAAPDLESVRRWQQA